MASVPGPDGPALDEATAGASVWRAPLFGPAVVIAEAPSAKPATMVRLVIFEVSCAIAHLLSDGDG